MREEQKKNPDICRDAPVVHTNSTNITTEIEAKIILCPFAFNYFILNEEKGIYMPSPYSKQHSTRTKMETDL